MFNCGVTVNCNMNTTK